VEQLLVVRVLASVFYVYMMSCNLFKMSEYNVIDSLVQELRHAYKDRQDFTGA